MGRRGSGLGSTPWLVGEPQEDTGKAGRYRCLLANLNTNGDADDDRERLFGPFDRKFRVETISMWGRALGAGGICMIRFFFRKKAAYGGEDTPSADRWMWERGINIGGSAAGNEFQRSFVLADGNPMFLRVMADSRPGERYFHVLLTQQGVAGGGVQAFVSINTLELV